MKPDMFREPVIILVGLGFPAEVRTVMDAYRHLVEWPASMRDTAYSVALRTCSATLRGLRQPEGQTVCASCESRGASSFANCLRVCQTICMRGIC